MPFFFKQWGEWIPVDACPKEWGHPADVKGKHDWVNESDGKNTGFGTGQMAIKVGKKKAGNLLDGKQHLDYPITKIKTSSPVSTCRVCGCTDNDCRQCIAKTGEPCYWVEEDLCSACVTPDDHNKEALEIKNAKWNCNCIKEVES